MQERVANYRYGFTIVELLVVIVVIGILASITIVSYTGVSSQATIASIKLDLNNVAKLLKLDQISGVGYPASLALANGGKGITASNGTTLQYAYNNTSNPQTFCIAATNGTNKYKITNDGAPLAGDCFGYGLVGYYALNEGAGIVAGDTSGNNNTGNFNGTPAWIAGKFSNGLNLAGNSSNYVSAPITFSTTNFTVAFWYKANATLASNEGLLEQSGSFAYFRQGTNDVQAYAYLNAPNNYAGPRRLRFRSFTNTNADGNWHLRVLVISVQSGTAWADEYEDGVHTRNSGVDYTGDTGSPSGNLRIGNDFQNVVFNGSMDDVRIYNRSLSASEVQSLYALIP